MNMILTPEVKMPFIQYKCWIEIAWNEKGNTNFRSKPCDSICILKLITHLHESYIYLWLAWKWEIQPSTQLWEKILILIIFIFLHLQHREDGPLFNFKTQGSKSGVNMVKKNNVIGLLKKCYGRPYTVTGGPFFSTWGVEENFEDRNGALKVE